MNLALVFILALAAPAPDAPADPPVEAPGLAEQKPGTWVRRLAARPLEDVGKLPRLSYESAFAYDRRAKLVVMWGGHGLKTDSPQLDETWLYDPAANLWRESAAPRRPVGSCCVRDAVYDEFAGRVVQMEGHFGGHGWQLPRGLRLRTSAPWLYDAAADRWTPMRPAFGPGPRAYKCMAWSPDHGVTLVFSGEGRPNDTWLYDSRTNAWFDMNPAVKPPARLAGGMCYDRAHKLFVLFGSSSYQALADTWTYDPARNEWKELRPEHAPPPGASPLLVYDEAAGRAVCFFTDNSKDGRGRIRAWTLDLDKPDWTAVAEAPPGDGPRYRNFAAAYVPELNVHVIGPGQPDGATGAPTAREVWTFRLKAAPAPEEPPAPRWFVTSEEKAVAVRVGTVEERVPMALWRAEGERPWALDWTEIVPKFDGFHRDEKVERGKVYHYRLKIGERFSAPLRAQPAVPSCPLVAPKADGEIGVTWPAAGERDVAGYNLYRARVSVAAAAPNAADRISGMGSFVKLNAELLAEPAFTDRADLAAAVERGGYGFAVYAYVVRAVNLLGVESGPSPWALSIPEQGGQ